MISVAVMRLGDCGGCGVVDPNSHTRMVLETTIDAYASEPGFPNSTCQVQVTRAGRSPSRDVRTSALDAAKIRIAHTRPATSRASRNRGAKMPRSPTSSPHSGHIECRRRRNGYRQRPHWSPSGASFLYRCGMAHSTPAGSRNPRMAIAIVNQSSGWPAEAGHPVQGHSVSVLGHEVNEARPGGLDSPETQCGVTSNFTNDESSLACAWAIRSHPRTSRSPT